MKYVDDFGDRMKSYEAIETERKLDPRLPIYVRIDGRAFSTFTRNMIRPFDPKMIVLMQNVTRDLVAKNHALIGYHQSDEISLIFEYLNEETTPLFGGRIMKICSVLASLAASSFQYHLENIEFGYSNDAEKLPHFDCRVINLPSREEAANMLLWRAMDAKKNAISMVAQHYFSHKELQHKDQSDMKIMLESKGIDLNRYPSYFMYGSFFKRKNVRRELTLDELNKIPPSHRPKDNIVDRSEVRLIEMPQFNTVKNRVGVIFNGENPIT